MSASDNNNIATEERYELACLTPRQVIMIDEALASLGQFGELRLVVEKGKLRFLVTQKSYDALKWRPGTLRNEKYDDR